MAKKAPKPTREELAENHHIISGIQLNWQNIKIKQHTSKIIKSSDDNDVNYRKKVQVVGGDSSEPENTPPTIIMEKDNNRISKIIVKCPCGRHAELECEYDDESPEQTTSPQQAPAEQATSQPETPQEVTAPPMEKQTKETQ